MKFTSEMDMPHGLPSCGLSALAFAKMVGSALRSDWVKYLKPEITSLGNGAFCKALSACLGGGRVLLRIDIGTVCDIPSDYLHDAPSKPSADSIPFIAASISLASFGFST